MKVPFIAVSFAALALFLGPAAIHSSGQKLPPGGHQIRLDECIQAALLRNRELQIERINPEIARLTLSGSYGYYDPVFTAGGRRQEATDTGGFDPADFSNDAIYRAESDIVDMGFTGYLPSGMSYSLGGNYAGSRGERNGLNFDSHKAVASVSVQQPLLRNFWIDKGRWVIQVNKKNLAITELGVIYLTMDVVNRVQHAYYELLYTRAVLEIQQGLLEARRQLLAGTRRKIEQGMLTAPDEKLAQSQVASVESALVLASNFVMLAENELRTLMGDSFTDSIPERLVPAEALFVLPESLNLSECRFRGLGKRPDLLQLREDIERSNIDLKYRRNQLFPSLDVVAGYGRKGADSVQVFPPFQAEASPSAAFAGIRRGDAPNHMFGLIFSIPLSRTAEKSNYRISKQIKEQVTLRLKQREELVLREVTDAWSTTMSGLDRVATARNARESAQAALTAEERKLAGGKSSLFFVLQLQADLATSQVLEARAKADYNQALSQLQFAEGSLLDVKRIVVEVSK